VATAGSEGRRTWWLIALALPLLPLCATAQDVDWEQAVRKMWITPHQNRLAFVMPWDSTRPEKARVCPPGETRQIWLDVDGHHLPPGKHRVRVTVRAERLPRGEAPVDTKAAPALKDLGTGIAGALDDLADQMETEDAPSRADVAKRLKALAAEEKERNYWYKWRGDKRPEKRPLPRERTFTQVLDAALKADDPLPEWVLWDASAWAGIPPRVLPPSLEDAAEAGAELCLDEWEPVCLTVTNLSELPLRFSVEFADADAKPKGAGPLVKHVLLSVEVWPIRLPKASRMEVYTWNYGNTSREHLTFLQSMKVNWFSLSNPDFTVEGDKLTCEFKNTDASIEAVKPFGKGMFIFSAVHDFNKKLAEQAKVKRDDARYEPLLRQYLTQWMQHMKDVGSKPEDYAIELWDEPGQRGYWDKDWVFELIAKAADIMRETEPKVQIMENPLMAFNQHFYDLIADDVTIWSPHGGTVYLTEDTREKTWEDAKGLNAGESHRNSCFMNQMYLKKLCREHGARRWTYYQHKPDATRCPLGYFRHFPWKNKWMGFEGVSFWSCWYNTGGALEDPIYLGTREWWLYALKGMYGWREGVEDVQYLEMLEDAAADLEAKGDAKAAPLRQAYESAIKRVVAQGWWATDPWKLEAAMKQSRREAARALIESGWQPKAAQ